MALNILIKEPALRCQRRLSQLKIADADGKKVDISGNKHRAVPLRRIHE